MHNIKETTKLRFVEVIQAFSVSQVNLQYTKKKLTEKL